MNIVNEKRRRRAIPFNFKIQTTMNNIIKQNVGIDVSQKTLDVMFGDYSIDQTISLKESRNFKNDQKAFQVFLKWVLKRADPSVPLFFTMEATGAYHEKLACFLVDNNQKVSVVMPTRASHYAKTLEVKTITDKEAAKTLTRMGLEKKLRLWEKPDPAYLKLRTLTRHREQLQKSKTVFSNQLHANGVSAWDTKNILGGIKKITKLLNEQIEEVEKQINKYIDSVPELKKRLGYLTSIKGIGTITAATLVGETNGFSEIKNKRQLVSYCGYDVIRKDSGTSVTSKPRMSKRGNRHIRRAMHFPALSAIRHSPTDKDQFIRMVQKHGIKMKAAVAIQRKLLVLAYTLWKRQENFDPNYHEQASKKIGQLTLP